MLEKQINALTIILKNEDIHKYTGEAFMNIIKAVILGDPNALIDAGKDIKEIISNMPIILFWDKMSKYMWKALNSAWHTANF